MIHQNHFQDFTDLQGDLTASDLRADGFSAMDYYRAGLSPPHNMPSMLDMVGDDLKLTPRNDLKFTPREGDSGHDIPKPIFETIHINSPRIIELVGDKANKELDQTNQKGNQY